MLQRRGPQLHLEEQWGSSCGFSVVRDIFLRRSRSFHGLAAALVAALALALALALAVLSTDPLPHVRSFVAVRSHFGFALACDLPVLEIGTTSLVLCVVDWHFCQLHSQLANLRTIYGGVRHPELSALFLACGQPALLNKSTAKVRLCLFPFCATRDDTLPAVPFLL